MARRYGIKRFVIRVALPIRVRETVQKKPRPLSAHPLCPRQAICLLNHGELPAHLAPWKDASGRELKSRPKI